MPYILLYTVTYNKYVCMYAHGMYNMYLCISPIVVYSLLKQAFTYLQSTCICFNPFYYTPKRDLFWILYLFSLVLIVVFHKSIPLINQSINQSVINKMPFRPVYNLFLWGHLLNRSSLLSDDFNLCQIWHKISHHKAWM